MDLTSIPVKGSCLCGVVQYKFDLPTKFVANCHCSECRRSNGAAFVTWVGTWEDKLQIVFGAENISTYTYPKPKEATRQFCKLCGSQLFFRGSRWPNEVHITRASVHGDVDRDIQAEVFYSDKADWFHFEKELPKLGGKTGTEKLPFVNGKPK